MLHVPILQIGFEISRKVARTVVRQQTRLVKDLDLFNPSFFQCYLQCIMHIPGIHRAGQLLGQDVAGVIIQHR